VALTVAVVAGGLTALLGATLGLLAGYFRGWVDLVVSRLIDIWMAFPPVLFSILLIAVLGPGLSSIIIAIVVIDWTRFARVVGPRRWRSPPWTTWPPPGRRPLAPRHPLARDPAQHAAHHRRAPHPRDGHRRHRPRRSELREPVAVSDFPTWGGMISEGRTSIHQAPGGCWSSRSSRCS
jgi:peptide/nickel transport system permease protein